MTRRLGWTPGAPREAAILAGLLAVGLAGVLGLAGFAGAGGPAIRAEPGADALGLLWTLWHVATSLFERGSLGVHTDLIGFPDGAVLFPADPLEAVVLAPLTRAFGPVAVFDGLQVVHACLAGACLFGLAHAVTGRRGSALAVVPVLLCSPVLLALLRNGNLDAEQVFWLPLAGWLAAAPGDQPVPLPRLLALTGCVACALVASVYVGIGAGCVALAMVFARPGGRRGPALAVLGGLLLAAPILLHAGTLLGAVGSVVEKNREPVLRMRLLEGSATILGFFTPGLRAVPDPRGGTSAFVTGQAVGGVAFALALFRLRRPDRLDACLGGLAAVGALLALGPFLVPAEAPARLGGRLVPLPFVFLDLFPPFSMLVELWRFSAIVQVAVALLAARTLAGLSGGAVGVGGGALLLEMAFWTGDVTSLRLHRLDVDPVAEALAGLPRGPVLSVPVRQGDWPLYWQTLHGGAVANTPMRMGDLPAFALETSGTFSDGDLLALARTRGYRWILLHRRPEVAHLAPVDALAVAFRDGGRVRREVGTLVVVDAGEPGALPVP